MKIAVLGGNGQLGCSFAKIADEYDWAQLYFYDLPQVDISSPVSVIEVLSGADIVINCAAWTAVDAAQTHHEEAKRANTDGAKVVAEAAKQLNIPLVHLSTDYVFDGSTNRPIKEGDCPAPLGVYGETKLAGEYAVSGSGARAIIVRTSWLYSEFGNNFVKTMLRLGRERGEVRVVNDQLGSPTYAVDLARAIMWLIERGINKRCEIYHYCNKGAISWYDFARAIFSEAGMNVKVLPISTAEYPTLALRPAYSVLSTEKIEALGLEITAWRDSLKLCITELKRMQNEFIII